MRYRIFAAVFCACLLVSAQATWPQSGHAEVQEIVRHALASNEAFMKAHGPDYFKPFIESQHPVVTVVECCDSRVQTSPFETSPDNRIFVIRDIGNQIATCEGSVDYGIHHLHTPVLLILGHVRCGAVKAAMGDYSKEPPGIRRELATLKVKKGGDWSEEVKANVSAQVRAAMARYGEEVKEGKLTVIGALYDFADDLKQGNGRLVIFDVNGDTDPAKVKGLIAQKK